MIGDTLYIWQAESEPDGWSTILAYIPMICQSGLLISREREVAQAFSGIAYAHGRQLGQRIRLSEFKVSETLVEYVP